MTIHQPKTIAAILVGALGFLSQAQGQGNCLTTFQYPGTAVLPASNGTVTEISGCNFEEEHSMISGIMAGGNYEFTLSTGGYITVREGTFDGSVVAQGYSPVTVNAASGADLFPHWTVDDQCNTASNCVITTVQLLLDCDQPVASVGYSEDCEAGTFTIQLDITSLGDGASVDVSWDVGGAVEEQAGVGLGPLALGPFPLGTVPVVTIHHASDPLCDLVLGPLAPLSNCPLPVVCGAPAIEQSYCYPDLASYHWIYEAEGTGTLRLTFTGGSIESANFDHLTIYDGLDANGPVLFDHLQTTQMQLAGLQVYSTTGALYMTMSSDGFGSCGTGGQEEWQWNVICLDCEIPVIGVGLEEDCEAGEYVIGLDVTSTGSGSTVDIIYSVNGDADVTVEDVAVGQTELGPFAIGAEVAVTVAHESNPLCNISLGTITDSGICPVQVICGAPAYEDSYCYVNNDSQSWGYVAVGSGTLRLSFTVGTIESANWDHLTIYDGPDANAPVLFNHTQTTELQLAGLEFYSTSGAFYVTMTADGVVSCSDGSQSQWEWNVVCLDCEIPAVGVGIVESCEDGEFTINLDVTSTGSGSTVDIVYSVNGGSDVTVEDAGVGEIELGPFVIGAQVTIMVAHESNPLCNISLGTITDSGNCPVQIVCGAPAFEDSYCYTNNDSQSWGYVADGSGTLRLTFTAGSIESSNWDHLTIYDGPDANGPVLFNHTQFAQLLLAGLEFYSTTGAFYMTMTSDGSSSCFDGIQSQWEWNVVCLDCQIPQVGVGVSEDCQTGEFMVDLDVLSTGSGATIDVVYTVNGGTPVTVEDVGTGETVIGPFLFDEVVVIEAHHESNPLCNIVLGEVTDSGTCPELIECGTDHDDIYCPGDDEDVRYYYQGTGTFPIVLFINAGSLEPCCDRVRVYDGADITAPELTPVGGVGGPLAGLFYISTNPQHRLTLQITSDGSVSCATGSAYQAIDWTVSCLDCNAPEATFDIVQDCANFQYYVDVVVTTMGTDTEMELTNNAGLPALTVSAPGTYQVGPFVSGTPVSLTLVNDANSLCNVNSGTLVNPLCPQIVCGAAVIEEEYCYGPNTNQAWAYELPGTAGTLRLTFLRGTIESNSWDRIRIYDGPSNTSPLLFEHNNSLTYNLGPDGSGVLNTTAPYYGVDVTATGANLYMEMTSDGSVQCSSMSDYDPFEWIVFCEGCPAPGVTYNLVADCFYREYTAEVIVTTAPPAEGLEIINTVTAQTITANATGTYNFGPYGLNDTAVFRLTALDNPACFFLSDSMTYASDSCIIRACGMNHYEYCYPNNEDRWYTFQSADNSPMSITFTEGQMLTGDRIVVYNGRNENSSVLYQGNNGGSLAGFALNSQNAENIITLRIQSNASGSCGDGQVAGPLRWWTWCGPVSVEEFGDDGLSVHPNPTTGLLTVIIGSDNLGDIHARVLDMSGRVVMEPAMTLKGGTANTIDLAGLANGQYMLQLISSEWVRNQRVQVSR